MYITSDLFGSGSSSDDNLPRFDPSTTASAPTWNTMADSQHEALGKRKRRDLDHAERPNSNSHTSCQRLSPHAGRPLKRHAVGHTAPDSNPRTTLYTQVPYLASEARPFKHLKRTSPKAKPNFVKSTSHLMDIETDVPCSTHHTSPNQDLRPCHICHTAPKRKKDLENYHECKRCQENTCFICARQCADSDCRETICRKCCVEVGEEGDTLCLGCYARNVNS